MNLTGIIHIAANWAQLNLDPGQTNNGLPIQGYVVLMKNPMAPRVTQAARIAAGYAYFAAEDSVHYTVSGQLTLSRGINYFLVTNAIQG